MSSRRTFLRGAAVAAATGSTTAVLSACGTRSAKHVGTIPANVKRSALRADVALLQQALDLEHTAIAAYTAGIPLLPKPARTAAQQFLSQEFSHAAELSLLIRHGGGKPNPPLPSYDLGRPRGPQDVLGLLHELERQMISRYLHVLPSLGPGPVRATIAAMLANEAQHISILRPALGRPAVPAPFVTSAE
jgi:hypothetical protein